MHIGPLPPAATTAPTPSGPQGFADPSGVQVSGDPPGPLSGFSFAGADISSLADGEPPDVAADVSRAQNVEFVNGEAFNSTKGLYTTSTSGGMYVYDTAGSQQKFADQVTFWSNRVASEVIDFAAQFRSRTRITAAG